MSLTCAGCGNSWGGVAYSLERRGAYCPKCFTGGGIEPTPKPKADSRPVEPSAPDSTGSRLLGFDELRVLPDLEWLIDELVPEAGLGVVYAPSGALKSFLAVDWALSVATGTSWLGHPVKQRWVVYVAAEGRGGIKQRVEAWWNGHGRPDMSRARWLLETVNLRDRKAVETTRLLLASLPESLACW